MDVLKIIAELREERRRIDEAISGLEKLTLRGTPRRGRPPVWSKVAHGAVPQSSNGQNGSSHGAALSPRQD